MDYLAKSHLRQLLIKHEDLKQYPYVCPAGKITIGVGYNLTDRGLPLSWISKQLDDDIDYFFDQLSKNFAWFDRLNEARKIALIDMCFNLGFKNFCEFKRMIYALQTKNFDKAAQEMLSSEWAKQVGKRAQELSEIVKTGEINHGLVEKTA